jgi:hypothetical protein
MDGIMSQGSAFGMLSDRELLYAARDYVQGLDLEPQVMDTFMRISFMADDTNAIREFGKYFWTQVECVTGGAPHGMISELRTRAGIPLYDAMAMFLEESVLGGYASTGPRLMTVHDGHLWIAELAIQWLEFIGELQFNGHGPCDPDAQHAEGAGDSIGAVLLGCARHWAQQRTPMRGWMHMAGTWMSLTALGFPMDGPLRHVATAWYRRSPVLTVPCVIDDHRPSADIWCRGHREWRGAYPAPLSIIMPERMDGSSRWRYHHKHLAQGNGIRGMVSGFLRQVIMDRMLRGIEPVVNGSMITIDPGRSMRPFSILHTENGIWVEAHAIGVAICVGSQRIRPWRECDDTPQSWSVEDLIHGGWGPVFETAWGGLLESRQSMWLLWPEMDQALIRDSALSGNRINPDSLLYGHPSFTLERPMGKRVSGGS